MTEKMTETQARTFDGHSTANETIVLMELAAKGCTTCLPYIDVFTFRRWKAQGFQVQKGQHGIHVTTYIPTYSKDESGEQVETGKRPWTSVLFCRHQVKPIEEKAH